MCTHTCTHTHTRTHTYTHMCTHAHTRTHTHTHTHTRTLTHSHTHTRTHACTHTCMHTHIHTHTGQFRITNVSPTEEGEASKVKVQGTSKHPWCVLCQISHHGGETEARGSDGDRAFSTAAGRGRNTGRNW